MSKTDELLPRPFCGKAMMLRGALWPSEGDRDAIIHAAPTDCPLYDFANETFDRSIVEVWNRRAAQPAVKALDKAELIESAVQAVLDAGLAVNGEHGVAAARHAARYALSALVSAPADRPIHTALPNYAGWRSIDTAPEDCRVILAAAGNWVGEAITLRDEDSGEQVWTWVDTGKPCRHSLYGWMHLPSPLSSPVLSDLRPDGFDGPTGAE